MEPQNGKITAVEHLAPITHDTKGSTSTGISPAHAAPEVVGINDGDAAGRRAQTTSADEIDEAKGGWFAYLRTRNFYVVLILG